MYLGVVILSVIVALIRKGKFSNIKHTKVSLWYLLVVALLIYIGLIVGTMMQIPFVLSYQFWIYFAVYLFVLLPVVFNFSNIWYVVLIAGVGLNFMATFINGGQMPVLQSAVEMGGNGIHTFMQTFGATNVLATITEPYVMPLCRMAAIPLGFIAIPVSIGDIIISVGLFFIVQKFMVVKESHKAPEKERLEYTGKLNFTSELNIDEIVKAAEGGQMTGSEAGMIAPDVDIAASSKGALDDFIFSAEEDVILGGDGSDTAQAPAQMGAAYGLIANSVNEAPAIEGIPENGLIAEAESQADEEDEFDSILRALDNVNNKQAADEAEKQQPLTMAQILEEQPIQEVLPEEEPQEKDEDIDVVLRSVEDIVQEEAEAAEEMPLQADEEIQSLMQDMIDEEVQDEQADDEIGLDIISASFDDIKPDEEQRDEADAMLRYMMSVFDSNIEEEPIFDEDEDDSYEGRLLKDILADTQAHRPAENSASVEIYPPADKEDVYEIEKVFDIIHEEALAEEKSVEEMTDDEIDVVLTQIRSFEQEPQPEEALRIGLSIEDEMGPEEEIDTANPFIIQNGRIVENPNYKFKKALDLEEQRRQEEAREEAIIAFDSTQNLEFIRKEIFAEMKRQEKEAGIAGELTEEAMMQKTSVIPAITDEMLEDASQSAERIEARSEAKEAPPTSVKRQQAVQEEYERVEFEIDGEIMYVWIKK